MSNQNYEQEINLRDYVLVILKRKWFIFSIFLSATIISFFITLFLPKSYKTNAVIRLGSAPEKLISNSNAIKELKSQRFINLAFKAFNLTGIDRKKQKIFLRVEDVKDTDFIEIIVENANSVLAADICNQIANNFVSEKKELFKQTLALKNETVEELERIYQDIERDSHTLSTKILNKSKESNYPLLYNTLIKYEEIESSLIVEISSLKKDILKSRDFEVLVPATVSGTAIKPNKKLIVATSGTLSFIFSIFVAFFLEFLQNSKISNKVVRR